MKVGDRDIAAHETEWSVLVKSDGALLPMGDEAEAREYVGYCDALDIPAEVRCREVYATGWAVAP